MGVAVDAEEDGLGGAFGGEGERGVEHHAALLDADLAAFVHPEEFGLRPALFQGLFVGAEVFRAVERGTRQHRNRIELKT
ncbi:hypothetical protein GCM10027262_27430 [Nocardia tengchongensis]